MPANNRLISYGSPMFDIERFESIENRSEFSNKPSGGLWSSTFTEDGIEQGLHSDWAEWVTFEMPERIHKLENAYVFELAPNANIYEIDTPEDLNRLSEQYGEGMLAMPGRPSFINWESVSKDYDGVLLTKEALHELYDDPRMFGWDVESTLIFNPDVVRSPIELNEYLQQTQTQQETITADHVQQTEPSTSERASNQHSEAQDTTGNINEDLIARRLDMVTSEDPMMRAQAASLGYGLDVLMHDHTLTSSSEGSVAQHAWKYLSDKGLTIQEWNELNPEKMAANAGDQLINNPVTRDAYEAAITNDTYAASNPNGYRIPLPTVEPDDLARRLEMHEQWLQDPETGQQLVLVDHDLSNADLSGANLREANLSGSYLTGANLEGANLMRADLSYADLTSTNLKDAYVEGTNTYGTDLRDARQSIGMRGSPVQDQQAAYEAGSALSDYDVQSPGNAETEQRQQTQEPLQTQQQEHTQTTQEPQQNEVVQNERPFVEESNREEQQVQETRQAPPPQTTQPQEPLQPRGEQLADGSYLPADLPPNTQYWAVPTSGAVYAATWGNATPLVKDYIQAQRMENDLNQYKEWQKSLQGHANTYDGNLPSYFVGQEPPMKNEMHARIENFINYHTQKYNELTQERSALMNEKLLLSEHRFRNALKIRSIDSKLAVNATNQQNELREIAKANNEIRPFQQAHQIRVNAYNQIHNYYRKTLPQQIKAIRDRAESWEKTLSNDQLTQAKKILDTYGTKLQSERGVALTKELNAEKQEQAQEREKRAPRQETRQTRHQNQPKQTQEQGRSQNQNRSQNRSYNRNNQQQRNWKPNENVTRPKHTRYDQLTERERNIINNGSQAEKIYLAEQRRGCDALMRDADPAVRLASASAGFAVGKMLSDDVSEVRNAAAAEAAKQGFEKERLLDTTDEGQRASIAQEGYYLDKLSHDASPGVRQAAEEYLSNNGQNLEQWASANPDKQYFSDDTIIKQETIQEETMSYEQRGEDLAIDY